MPEYPARPERLAFVLQNLSKEMRQDFVETRMDAGPPKRRAKSSPYAVYTGTVQLDGSEKLEFDVFVERVIGRSPFFISLPDEEKQMLAVFYKAPVDRKNSFTVGRPERERHEIEISLRSFGHSATPSPS